jgi:DDE superfamily endonuclease
VLWLKITNSSHSGWLNFHVFEPEEGRRHDSTLYRNSKMNADLAQSLVFNDRQLCLVADSAYTLHPWLQTMLPGIKMRMMRFKHSIERFQEQE